MTQSIGQQLKQAREERHLTIEKAVESTRIRAYYLEALEADELESLPSPVQARAFLRIYAGFLGLDLDRMIARQREQAAPPSLAETTELALSEEPSSEEELVTPEKGWLQEGFARLKQSFSRQASPAQGANPSLNGQVPNNENNEITEAVDETVSPAYESSKADPAPVSADVEESLPKNEPVEKTAGEAGGMFAAIGLALRQRRETLSLSFEEIERHTHVRIHYLQALEDGAMDELPSSVQARGMLSNYAGFLDMDVEAVLLQFAEALQARRLERQPAQNPETPRKSARSAPFKLSLPPVLQRILSMDVLVGGGMVLLLLVFAVWGTSRVIGMRNAEIPQPTAPSISDILGNAPITITSSPTATFEGNQTTLPTLPTQPGDTPVVTFPASGPGVVHVIVVGLKTAWVRVVVDQKTAFDGRITPGAAYPYDGNTQIEVLTGNGAAVSILYNESDLGAMGTLGEVVDHIYTANSILNPTPTSTNTPTITPKPSSTVRPTATPRPTSTPRFSPTAKQ